MRMSSWAIWVREVAHPWRDTKGESCRHRFNTRWRLVRLPLTDDDPFTIRVEFNTDEPTMWKSRRSPMKKYDVLCVHHDPRLAYLSMDLWKKEKRHSCACKKGAHHVSELKHWKDLPCALRTDHDPVTCPNYHIDVTRMTPLSSQRGESSSSISVSTHGVAERSPRAARRFEASTCKSVEQSRNPNVKKRRCSSSSSIESVVSSPSDKTLSPDQRVHRLPIQKPTTTNDQNKPDHESVDINWKMLEVDMSDLNDALAFAVREESAFDFAKPVYTLNLDPTWAPRKSIENDWRDVDRAIAKSKVDVELWRMRADLETAMGALRMEVESANHLRHHLKHIASDNQKMRQAWMCMTCKVNPRQVVMTRCMHLTTCFNCIARTGVQECAKCGMVATQDAYNRVPWAILRP